MSNVIPTPGPAAQRRAKATPPGRAVYTVAEVAELLDLSLGGTYAMVRAGQIPARRMGGRWVISKRRFHTWLDELPEATDEEVAAALGVTTGGAE
jgi:excisionase family DNA binding protein